MIGSTDKNAPADQNAKTKSGTSSKDNTSQVKITQFLPRKSANSNQAMNETIQMKDEEVKNGDSVVPPNRKRKLDEFQKDQQQTHNSKQR